MNLNLPTLIMTLILLSFGCNHNSGSNTSQHDSNNNTVPTSVPSVDVFRAIATAKISLQGTSQWCTGTLIAPNLVVSAAHCFFDDVTRLKSYPPLSVSIRQKDGSMSVSYEVSAHGISDYLTHDFEDIAWIKLKSDVINASPIKIATRKDQNLELPIGTKTHAFGFSSNAWKERIIEALDPAQTLATPVLKIWEIPTSLEPKMLGGDSGGPLIIKQNEQWLLLGVLQGEKLYTGKAETSFTSLQAYLADLNAAGGSSAIQTIEINNY